MLRVLLVTNEFLSPHSDASRGFAKDLDGDVYEFVSLGRRRISQVWPIEKDEMVRQITQYEESDWMAITPAFHRTDTREQFVLHSSDLFIMSEKDMFEMLSTALDSVDPLQTLDSALYEFFAL